MAVLETIRVKFGIVITVLIAIALLSFIIDPSSLSMFGAGQDVQETEVASINGTDVTYTEFNDHVRMYNNMYPYDMYESVMLQRNSELTTDELKKSYDNEIRSMVMNDLLMKNLYVVKAKAAGFNVSEEEMYQLLSGKIYSNTIASQFQGQMTPELLVELESSENPMWDNIKKSTESERYLAKYTTTFIKSMFSNSLLVEENIKNSNNVFNVEFVMVPYEVGRDTSIVVSENEINEYYTAHKNLFPCEETREISYIVVDVDAATDSLEYAKLSDILVNVKDAENFRKAAQENDYLVASAPVNMYATSFGSVAGVENIVKWAFKESEVGGVSDIYTIENDKQSYLVVAALENVTPAGYFSIDAPQVRFFIQNTLYMEKAADKKLAEVSEKINGLEDLKEIAKVLGTSVSTKENLTFASSDFDQKFTGAASVAPEGVVNAPLKGSNGVYVYKVTGRSEGAYFTEDDAKMSDMQLGYMYNQVLSSVLGKEGNVKDYTYLYF